MLEVDFYDFVKLIAASSVPAVSVAKKFMNCLWRDQLDLNQVIALLRSF